MQKIRNNCIQSADSPKDDDRPTEIEVTIDELARIRLAPALSLLPESPQRTTTTATITTTTTDSQNKKTERSSKTIRWRPPQRIRRQKQNQQQQPQEVQQQPQCHDYNHRRQQRHQWRRHSEQQFMQWVFTTTLLQI